MIPYSESGVALLYHDVVPEADADESGIVTDGSWRYKLAPAAFRDHLEAIAASEYHVTTLPDPDGDRPLLLTFDDGGVSCAETAAPLLEEYGFRGHFFVITGRLGDPGYMSREQVRQLADAGHHVGSHTVTHANLRTADPDERKRELRESKAALENLLGTTCRAVSIPGGFADRSVVEAAFDVGYDHVFVSEPRYVEAPFRGRSIGRWNVWHNTSAADLEAILDRDAATRLRIQGRWYLLKSIKRLVGQDRFERLRQPFVSKD